MDKLIRLQPSPRVDNIVDGREMYQLPYPYTVAEDGKIANQDFWQGEMFAVIGFQQDPAVQRIDLWWKDAAEDPQKAVGMYLVTTSRAGNWSVHDTAIRDAEVLA